MKPFCTSVLLSSLLLFVDSRSLHSRTSLQSSLFPSRFSYSSGYTTASSVSLPGVSYVALGDSALNVIRPVASQCPHPLVQQVGKTAWLAKYPQGSWSPGNNPPGGFGFYLGGTDVFANAIARGSNEVLFSYSVMFQNGWRWNKGGKIPGGFGGIGSNAFSCSGGRQDGRQDCFDLRLMWRANATGELYTYLPQTSQNTKAQSSVPPNSIEDTSYGFSVGRGAFNFPAGTWVTIAERIKLNDPTSYNGEVEIFINGQSVISLTGVSMRNSSKSVIQGMHFQTFFGGSTSDWASPQDQNAWFADVSGAIITAGSSSNNSNTPNTTPAQTKSGSSSTAGTQTTPTSTSTVRSSGSCSGFPTWKSTVLYQPGGSVVYSKKLWMANNWTARTVPGSSSSAWQLITSC